MSIFSFKENKRKELQKHYDLLSEKLERLRRANIIETDVAIRFRLEKEIEEAEQERDEITQKIVSIGSLQEVSPEHIVIRYKKREYDFLNNRINRLQKRYEATTNIEENAKLKQLLEDAKKKQEQIVKNNSNLALFPFNKFTFLESALWLVFLTLSITYILRHFRIPDNLTFFLIIVSILMLIPSIFSCFPFDKIHPVGSMAWLAFLILSFVYIWKTLENFDNLSIFLMVVSTSMTSFTIFSMIRKLVLIIIYDLNLVSIFHLIQYSLKYLQMLISSSISKHLPLQAFLEREMTLDLQLPFLDRWLVKIFNQNQEVGTKVMTFAVDKYPVQRLAVQKALTQIILVNAQKIASLAELAKFSEFIGSLPLELSEDFDSSAQGANIILRLADVCGIAKNIIQVGSQFVEDKQLQELLLTLQKLKEDKDIQKEWYAKEVLELAGKWAGIVEKERKTETQKVQYIEIPNPFIYGKPIQVEESNVFVGRRDIIEKIQAFIEQDPKPTLFLYGRRRTGKTSALLNLNRYIGRQIIPVFINMQDLRFRESSQAFCSNVSKEISKLIPELHKIQQEYDFEQNSFTKFHEFLDKTEQHVSQKETSVLLTFDEYERVEEKDKDILDTLRNIIQFRRKIVVLVSGSHRFEEITKISWSDYLINTKTVEISYLDKESAYKLITQPVENFDLQYSEGIPEKIIELTHCQPFLLQAVASELVNYLNFHRRKQATSTDLETVTDGILTAAEAYFDNVWFQECNEDERKFLEEIVLSSEETLTVDSQNINFRSLLRREILERQNEKVRIAVPLLQEWIGKKQLML